MLRCDMLLFADQFCELQSSLRNQLHIEFEADYELEVRSLVSSRKLSCSAAVPRPLSGDCSRVCKSVRMAGTINRGVSCWPISCKRPMRANAAPNQPPGCRGAQQTTLRPPPRVGERT